MYTTHEWTLVLHSCTTWYEFDILKNAHIWQSHVPKGLLIILNSTECYYTMSFWNVGWCRQTQIRFRYTWINSSATEAYYIILVWHLQGYRHTHMRDTIPNWPELYRILVYHVSLRYRRIQTYPCHIYTHTICSQCYRVQLCHISLTYGRMEMYACEMYTIPLIAFTTTEFYHTMSLSYVAECRCTHMRPYCYRKHLNWLKCFHVTIVNNCSSHSVLSWGFIRNYLMHHFHLYVQRAHVSIFSFQHLMHVMNCDVV